MGARDREPWEQRSAVVIVIISTIPKSCARYYLVSFCTLVLLFETATRAFSFLLTLSSLRMASHFIDATASIFGVVGATCSKSKVFVVKYV